MRGTSRSTGRSSRTSGQAPARRWPRKPPGSCRHRLPPMRETDAHPPGDASHPQQFLLCSPAHTGRESQMNIKNLGKPAILVFVTLAIGWAWPPGRALDRQRECSGDPASAEPMEVSSAPRPRTRSPAHHHRPSARWSRCARSPCATSCRAPCARRTSRPARSSKPARCSCGLDVSVETGRTTGAGSAGQARRHAAGSACSAWWSARPPPRWSSTPRARSATWPPRRSRARGPSSRARPFAPRSARASASPTCTKASTSTKAPSSPRCRAWTIPRTSTSRSPQARRGRAAQGSRR